LKKRKQVRETIKKNVKRKIWEIMGEKKMWEENLGK
jgi:hypothetical protein